MATVFSNTVWSPYIPVTSMLNKHHIPRELRPTTILQRGAITYLLVPKDIYSAPLSMVPVIGRRGNTVQPILPCDMDYEGYPARAGRYIEGSTPTVLFYDEHMPSRHLTPNDIYYFGYTPKARMIGSLEDMTG